MISRLLLIITLLAVIVSCGDKYLSLSELKEYPLKQENGLFKSIQTQPLSIELIYRPKDLIIAQDVDLSDSKSWDERKGELDSLDYFILKLSRNGDEVENTYVSNTPKYQSAIGYLSEGIGLDLYLLRDNKRVKPEAVFFSPTFGGSTASSVMIIFKSYAEKSNSDFTIAFDDNFFGSGRNEFKFSARDIRNCPSLKK